MASESLAYSVANQDTSWRSFDCPDATARWRFLGDGHVEIDGQGTPTAAWPTKVDRWHEEILSASTKYGVPAAWIAAVMCIESGGDDKACRLVNGVCSTGEGAGLMQILASTATSIEGRKITNADLINDPALNIDLGTKYLRGHLDDKFCRASSCKPVAGDFVKAAVAYNAGGVRCGSGRTWEQKEPCPATPWGVVMGCTLAGKDVGGCEASTLSPGKYKCPNMYPLRFITALNTAVGRGWGDFPPGYEMWPSPAIPWMTDAPASRFLWAVAAGVAGYLAVLYLPHYLPKRLWKRSGR